MTFVLPSGTPAVGIAYSRYINSFLERHPDAIDYVEVPFELLRHNPAAIAVNQRKPVVLHCASLSLAGSVPPPPEVMGQVRDWVERTRTPWLGEHLSFITAEQHPLDGPADAYAPDEPWNIGFTVSPPMNPGSVELVLASLARAKSALKVPLLVENPPIYFLMPSSTMSQVEFINAICAQSDVSLLLDLAHFYISARALDYDPLQEVTRLPLDRVVEVHLSGVDIEEGGRWDNHASRAPQVEFDLLREVIRRAPVRAITLEYNWSSRFPESVLLDEIARTRAVIAYCPAS
jgi:uncharacterized protein (UPF0276 family)